MQGYQSFFKGKRVTLMGLGLLGRGVGDARFLAECGAQLTVTDLKGDAELQQSLDALAQFPVRYTLGRHDIADFRECDLVIHAAGVPLDSPYVAEARKNGIPATQSVALFSRFAREEGATLVGVTGTRGKSTVSHMLDAILSAAGKKVLLGGNIPGMSTLAMLPQIASNTITVLELDSWQLQAFREEKISPSIAMFTTFYPDHFNYYHGDMDAYLADKANIFLYQKPTDLLILGSQCAGLIQEKYGKRFGGRFEVWGENDFPKEWQLKILGEHNRYDAALALAAARALAIPEGVSRAALQTFKGVPGRLELVREVGGVKFYNDTTATTPEATIAALRALDPAGAKNIILIMGGADKGLDMSSLRPEVHAHCKKVLFLAGTGTERIRDDAPDTPLFESLQAALAAAVAAARAGDIVLFSPAFASFGMFKNEYDRGAQFDVLVATL